MTLAPTVILNDNLPYAPPVLEQLASAQIGASKSTSAGTAQAPLLAALSTGAHGAGTMLHNTSL
jgi:hypothetical protein